MSQGKKFRELARAMQKTIDDKRRPRLENTWRRANIAASIRDDARKLERLQDKLFALADAHDAGQVPAVLQSLKHKSQIQALLYYESVYGDYVLAQTGYKTAEEYLEAREALLALGDVQAGQKTAADLIADLERDLIGSKIPGFFPTPPEVLKLLLVAADIQPGDWVLEPSAGSGKIADGVRQTVPTARLDVIEIVPRLRRILEAKGYSPLPTTDFLEYEQTGYDVVIMNPPFEHFQDIKHVRHAWERLKPGGRLVSVMGESAFFRSDKIAFEFRKWLDDQDVIVVPLVEGAFKESGTMVRTRVVILEKPGGSSPCPPAVESKPLKTPVLISHVSTIPLSPENAALPPSEGSTPPPANAGTPRQLCLPGFE